MWQNKRGTSDYANEHGASDYAEPPWKKPRDDYAASTRTFQSQKRKAYKQELRLARLGFYDDEYPTQDELEKAYSSRKDDVDNSTDSSENKAFQLKKLKSAFNNVGKARSGRSPEPSTDDERAEDQAR